MSFPEGKVVIGKVINTAVNSSPSEIVWKDINGVTVTLASGQRVIYYAVHVNNRATAKDITIFQDTDAGVDLDTGEESLVYSFAAAGTWTDDFPDGLPTRKTNAAGTNKHYVTASAAGAVDITIVAQIIND